MLASLRAAYPAARIDWLVQDTFADAIADHPALDGVVPFCRSRMGRWSDPVTALRTLDYLASLRRARYDLVIDCQGLFRSGVFTRATGAPVRAGYANAQELGWLGLTHRVDVPRERHSVERMLAILESIDVPAVPDMRLYIGARSKQILDRLALRSVRYALFAPGSRWEGKRWPAERFAAVAKAMLDAGDVERVVVVGSSGERSACEALVRLVHPVATESTAGEPSRIIDAMGQTSVGELMALVKHAALLIANDSAALHMGVGFDRPIVGLFGPTDVKRVGPMGRSDAVVQHVTAGEELDHKAASAGRAMMERIGVDEVLERARQQMVGTAQATR